VILISARRLSCKSIAPKLILVPLIRGPLWDLEKLPGHIYSNVESLVLQFETDPDAITPLLPEPYKPGKSPVVTVMFNDNNGVDFMAGGGYRFAAISVSAEFHGENGRMEGSYVLAMPESRTLPIITGREWLGMPKFFMDISSI
jgi:acetoacetate decarboxylase